MATKTQENPKAAYTSVDEVVAAALAQKITGSEATRLIASLSAKGRERSVKVNKSGGLYVYDPAMGAGLNLSPIGAVRALFDDAGLIEEIRTYLSPSNNAQRERDQREAIEKAAEREAKKAAKRK